MGGIKGTTHGVNADEATLTKTGNQIGIKNAGSSIVGGELLYIDSNGDTQQLNPGTANQILKTQGDGSAPTWGGVGAVLIDSTTLTGTATSVSFTSIPTGYKKFILIGDFVDDSTDIASAVLRLNNDSGGNYSYSTLSWNGSAVAGANATAQTGFQCGSISNVQDNSHIEVSISNHTETMTKGIVSTHAIGRTTNDSFIQIVSGVWHNTADEISRVDFIVDNNMAVGSTFALYGLA